MAKRTVSNTHQDFNPKNLKIMRSEITAALKTVAERHGVSFELGNVSYTPVSFSVRLEAKRPDSDQRDFEQHAASCGLQPSDFGAVFTYENARYTISGINARTHTFPIVTTREDGRCITFREDIVREALKAGRSSGNGEVTMAGHEDDPVWLIDARFEREGWEWEETRQKSDGRRLAPRTLREAISLMKQFLTRNRGLRMYGAPDGGPVNFYLCMPIESKDLRMRVRNVQTGDILTFEQVQAIINSHFPLIPEVLDSFFAANRKTLNTGAEGELATKNPE